MGDINLQGRQKKNVQIVQGTNREVQIYRQKEEKTINVHRELIWEHGSSDANKDAPGKSI